MITKEGERKQAQALDRRGALKGFALTEQGKNYKETLFSLSSGLEI